MKREGPGIKSPILIKLYNVIAEIYPFTTPGLTIEQNSFVNSFASDVKKKLLVKSHEMSPDLRDSSVLIGWNMGSHDFLVRYNWRIYDGAPGTRTPLGVQILSFSCSFEQIIRKIIDFWQLTPPPGENPGSTTGYRDTIRTGDFTHY